MLFRHDRNNFAQERAGEKNGLKQRVFENDKQELVLKLDEASPKIVGTTVIKYFYSSGKERV